MHISPYVPAFPLDHVGPIGTRAKSTPTHSIHSTGPRLSTGSVESAHCSPSRYRKYFANAPLHFNRSGPTLPSSRGRCRAGRARMSCGDERESDRRIGIRPRRRTRARTRSCTPTLGNGRAPCKGPQRRDRRRGVLHVAMDGRPGSDGADRPRPGGAVSRWPPTGSFDAVRYQHVPCARGGHRRGGRRVAGRFAYAGSVESIESVEFAGFAGHVRAVAMGGGPGGAMVRGLARRGDHLGARLGSPGHPDHRGHTAVDRLPGRGAPRRLAPQPLIR